MGFEDGSVGRLVVAAPVAGGSRRAGGLEGVEEGQVVRVRAVVRLPRRPGVLVEELQAQPGGAEGGDDLSQGVIPEVGRRQLSVAGVRVGAAVDGADGVRAAGGEGSEPRFGIPRL